MTDMYTRFDLPLRCSTESLRRIAAESKTPYTLIYTGSLHHTTVRGNVTEQYCKTAILGISIFKRAYATVLPVGIKGFIY